MDILNTISVTTDTAETIFRISTFEWDKKSLGKLAFATSAFAGIVAAVKYIEQRDRQREINETKKIKRKRR